LHAEDDDFAEKL